MKTKTLLMYAAAAAGAYYLYTKSQEKKAAPKKEAAAPPAGGATTTGDWISVDQVSAAQVEPALQRVPMAGMGSLSGHVFR